MHAFHDARRGHEELKNLREEHRSLPLHIAAARLPADPRVVHGRKDEIKNAIRPQRTAGAQHRGRLNGYGLLRNHIRIKVNERQCQPVDQPGLGRQCEPAFAVFLRHVNLILHLDVERAVLLGEKLESAL